MGSYTTPADVRAYSVDSGVRVPSQGRVKYPQLTEDRLGWKQALAETKDEWQAAYLDEPTHVSEGLARVLRDHEEPRESGELQMVA
jgi:hypothetical protein